MILENMSRVKLQKRMQTGLMFSNSLLQISCKMIKLLPTRSCSRGGNENQDFALCIA